MIEPIVLDNLVLDGEAVCHSDGTYTDSQQGWETYFFSIGKRLPTVKEYVSALKQLDERNDSALQGIIQDLRESMLCTRTKIDYETSNIPVGNGYLDQLVKDSAWKNALEDEVLQYDIHEAVKVLQKAGGKIQYIWTPSTEGRKSHPERAIWLNLSSDLFGLYCDYLYYAGRSRGVRDSASVSEQEAPRGATSEIKLLQAPANIHSQNHLEQPIQTIYNPNELAYATGLLNGSSRGTVMDWKSNKK